MTHTCPLCGFSFDASETVPGGCAACPSSPGSCGLTRCPACGYEWPEESSSKVATLLRRILGGGGAKR